MALRTPAHNFSLAQKRVVVTSKRRQCSCRTCQTAYCRTTAPGSNLRAAISLPQGGPAGAVGSRRAQGALLCGSADVRTWTPPTLPGFQCLMACKERLHPYIRTFAAARAAVPDGIGWLAPNRFFALEVLRTFWV